MQRFRNILLFTHGGACSTVAFDRASALARRNRAQLTVLSVLEAIPRELLPLTTAVEPAELCELAVSERKETLDRLVAGTADIAGFTTKVLVGSPCVEVINEVLRQGHDLVMLAAEGKRGAGSVLFGGTSTQLMRNCPCPVWVVKSDGCERHGGVMAAVDPMPCDVGHASLNLAIMQLASSLARIEAARLDVVHAWLPVTEPISVFGRLPLAAPELVAEARQEHQTALDALLQKSDLNGLRVDVHLVRGEAGTLIPHLARESHIDVIVMGTVCRTGVPGLLIGNTAEKVLRKVNVSVLTVKPEGFVSPVARAQHHGSDERRLVGQMARTENTGR